MSDLRAAVLAALFLSFAALPISAQGVEDMVQACAACHGDNGMPKIPEAPIIWGQHAGYIYVELKDFKSGARKSDIMQPLVANLKKADMLAIAEYFEAKPWPATGYQSTDADKAAGERIATSGMCTQCHLGGFLGTSTIPRTGGQTETYLHKTLLDFKTRARANNPDKSTLLASYSDDDLAAMARYLAGQ
jgi:cytochrome c553